MSDSLWVIKQKNSDIMIQSPEFGKPLDNMEVAKNCPIWLLAELEVVTNGPREHL